MVDHVFPAAFSLLPEGMDSPEARAMLVAIGLQESGFLHRAQIGGPAHGFWQFEKGGGVAGVLTHPSTARLAADVCESLRYEPEAWACYVALEHNDVLACCFARLLLWTLPGSLPAADEADEGWHQYLDAWRPGKPHRETWAGHFGAAWELVTSTDKEP